MDDPLSKARPRRVLHIGKYFPPHRGGMETILRDQMNIQTRDEGLTVSAVVHSSERRLTDKVDITDLGYRVRRSARWVTAIFAPIAPFFWWSILREIRELDPDEIKIHMPNLSAFWLLLLPSARARKWVILWHSDVLPSRHSIGLRALYWLYRPAEVLLLTKADKIVVTSPPYLESSAPLSRFRKKCTVIPLRLDLKAIPAAAIREKKPARMAAEGVRVLCVGRLSYYKGFGTAIKAVAKIPDAHLKIVGDGDMRRSLMALIKSLRVEERIEILGNVNDATLWRLYRWCDIHCLPSIERTEAFGLSVTEAALFDRPSVVSNLKDSGLVWNAENTGVPFTTASPGDADSFAAAILRLYEHQRSTKIMSQRGFLDSEPHS